MKRAFLVALAAAFVFGAAAAAQSPHGAPASSPQIGPNVNAASGIVANPADPSALVKTDLLLQRQNETVVAASTRNPDHILAAANDYRFVDFPQDSFDGEQAFLTRLLAKLTFRQPARPAQRRATTVGVGAWTGVYRSCDRGATFIGSAVPGGPLDQSPASLASPLKAFSNAAAALGGTSHAETTDPVVLAGPNGQMHLFVLGFVRLPDGRAIDGRMYHVSYTDRNNREGGSCFNYDYTVEMDRSAGYATPRNPQPFLDKPSGVIDRDGTIYVSYTLFDDDVHSRIVVARSTDGGMTWTKTMPLLNAGFLRNHGTSMAVDPKDGTVYLAWRTFYQNWPMVLVSRSIGNGKFFLAGTPINSQWPAKNIDQIVAQLKANRLQPFDQFGAGSDSETITARTFAFPNIVAGLVNGRTRLFAFWSERVGANGLPSANGSPRIVVSASDNGGETWSERRAIDMGPRTEVTPGVGAVSRPSGPQVQPVANISGTQNPQLLLAYYESRDELSAPLASSFVSGIERQMDVRIARIDPATLQLLAPSSQVSQYAVQANTSPAQLAETAPGYSAVHRENLKLYGGGFKAFFGDYMSLSATTTLVSSPRWDWSADPASALVIWTDHRDVKFPFNAVTQQPDINGRWDLYTPITAANATCDNVGMRNSNPYMAEIGGVIAGAPQTFKPLTIQRAFATYVVNQTPVDRYFRLTVLDNEAQGLDASFDQFAFGSGHDVQDVKVFGKSKHGQTIYVQPLPSNPTAQVRVTVQEIDALGGTLKPNGLRTSFTLNPDPNNDALTPVPPATPQGAGFDPGSSELHDPSIGPRRVSNFQYKYPGVSTPQIDSPQIDSPQIDSPQIDSPQIDTPQIDSRGTAAPQIDSHLATPQIDSNGVAAPQIDSPQIDSVAPDNGTDVTYTVSNSGTTTSTYKAAFNVPNVEALLNSGAYQFIVIISKTSLAMSSLQQNGVCVPAALPQVQVLANVPVPASTVAQLATLENPQIDSTTVPDIVTFTLAPVGGVAGENPALPRNDAQSTVLPDQIKVTLRAIRKKTLAQMAADGDPIFDPNGVVLKVESKSTNVVNGVVQPAGTQPAAVSKPDLFIAGYTVATPQRSAGAGTQVTLSPWTLRNGGTAVRLLEGSVGIGYYLSTDPVIDAQDRLLLRTGVGNIAAGGSLPMAAQTLTIPADVSAGSYFVGILVDDSNILDELNEQNNSVSEPIAITGPRIFQVTNTASSGPGSLRQAILDSNADPGFPATTRPVNRIRFSIPIVEGTPTISVQSALPPLTAAAIVDATATGACTANTPPRVQLNWLGSGPADGLTLSGMVTVRGLSITNFPGDGILISNVGVNGAAVECSWVGITPTDVAAGNGVGIEVAGTSSNVILGGPSGVSGNVISGNTGNGVLLNGAGVSGVHLLGNFIGLNSFGNNPTPNGGNGVQIVESASNAVGGSKPDDHNVISGNAGEGVRLDGAGATGNVITGNFIGPSASGHAAFGNSASGIYLRRAPQNFVIGNFVSGNLGFAGIAICGNLDFCGGGEGPGANNAANNVLQGNKVGFNVPGDAAMGNAGFGVSIDAAPGTVIGGTQAGQGNLIGASGADGIVIVNGAASTVVQGNSIGNDGTLNRGNGGAGVNIADGSNTVVGGDAPGEANTIAFNGAAGISVAPLATNVSNTFASNTWRDNAGLAIDLGADGGTANDGPGDADTGANGQQNFPDLVLTATNTDTLVHIDLQSALQSKFVIRFYLVSSCDARLFSHTPFDPATIVEVTTNSDGFGSRDVTLPIQLTAPQGIAATATDPGGNTSEISACGQFSVAPVAGAFSTQPSAPEAAISRERRQRR